jgi:hypothetical protein
MSLFPVTRYRGFTRHVLISDFDDAQTSLIFADPRSQPITVFFFLSGRYSRKDVVLDTIARRRFAYYSTHFCRAAVVTRYYGDGFHNGEFDVTPVRQFLEHCEREYDGLLAFSVSTHNDPRLPCIPLMRCAYCHCYTMEWVREMRGTKRSQYLYGVYCLMCRCLMHRREWLLPSTDYASVDLNPAWLQYSAIMEGVVQERGLVADVRQKIMEMVAAAHDTPSPAPPA